MTAIKLVLAGWLLAGCGSERAAPRAVRVPVPVPTVTSVPELELPGESARPPDPDYPGAPDAVAARDDEPDRGPPVPLVFARPPRGTLDWRTHAHCVDDLTGIVCSSTGPSATAIRRWRVGRDRKGTVVAELVRAGRVDATYIYQKLVQRLQRVQIDAYGRVATVVRFSNDRYSMRKLDGGNGLARCGAMAYKLDDAGRRSEVSCLQWGGAPMVDRELVATTRLTRDAQGFVTDELRLGLDGQPIPESDGVPRVSFERDRDGRVRFERYRDAGGGKRVADDRGCFGRAIERDERDEEVRTSCLGADDRPIVGVSQLSVEELRNDRRGCRVEQRRWQPNGAAAVDRAGVHAVAYTVDDHCAVTSRTCLGLSYEAVDCGTGEPARYVFTRDAFGNIVSSRHFTATGEPGGDPIHSMFEVRERYDERGRRTERACFGEDGRPSICGRAGGSTGSDYAGERIAYDDAGHAVEFRFFDDKGAVARNLGVTARRERYDAYDRRIEARYLDGEGQPFPMAGATLRRDLYDAKHRHVAVLLFEGTGKPARYTACFLGVSCPEGTWHAVRIVRRSDGSLQENRFFDEQGHLIEAMDCGAEPCFD